MEKTEVKNKKKFMKFFSFQINVDDLLPATPEERKQQMKMKESSSFFKDGMRRLWKNKVAMTCVFVLGLIILSVIFIPMFWPYKYEEQLGIVQFEATDLSYKNLGVLEYGTTEKIKNAKYKLGLDETTGPNGTVEYRLGEMSVEWKYTTESEWKDLVLYSDLAESAGYQEKIAQIEYDVGVEKSGRTLWRYIIEPYPWQKVIDTELLPSNFITSATKLDHIDYQVNTENGTIEWKSIATEDEYEKLIEVNKLESSFQLAIARYSNVEYEYTDGTLKWREQLNNEWVELVRIATVNKAKGEKVFPHLFGTDDSGRDYFIRVIYGARVSLAVGLFASLIVLIIGTIYGSISGYFGGKVDLIMMRIVDIIYALPDMLIIILLSVVLKSILSDKLQDTVFASLGANMISIFIVFGLLYWVGMARLIRGQILSLKEQEYVLAARSIGAKPGRIIRKHLLPNCISVIIISTALQIPSAIFTESFLSFLGLGVASPMPSLGSLASDALSGVYTYTYRLILPAIFICLIVLSLNLLGDGLRDAFDPKLKN